MFFNNYYNPYGSCNCSHNSSRKLAFDYLIKAIERGNELLRLDLSFEVLNVWQDYVKTIFELINKSYGPQPYIIYLEYISNIMHLKPYEQLRLSIQKLLEIAKAL